MKNIAFNYLRKTDIEPYFISIASLPQSHEAYKLVDHNCFSLTKVVEKQLGTWFSEREYIEIALNMCPITTLESRISKF